MDVNNPSKSCQTFSENCPLCTIPLREKLYYSNERVYVCETKDKKGHKTRIMIASIAHVKEISREFEQYAIKKLTEIGSKIFTGGWIIVKGMTSVPDHWHLIAEDETSTDPKERQLLETMTIIWRSR